MRILGWSIIAVVFGAMFSFVAYVSGVKAALTVFILTSLVSGALVLATFLITGGQS